jgi:hypothetical protein
MRQNSIITLSDQCKKEIDNIKREKEALMKDYDAKKKELHTEFLGKQSALNRLRAEIEEMSQYKVTATIFRRNFRIKILNIAFRI